MYENTVLHPLIKINITIVDEKSLYNDVKYQRAFIILVYILEYPVVNYSYHYPRDISSLIQESKKLPTSDYKI